MTNAFYVLGGTGSEKPFYGRTEGPRDYADLQNAWRGNGEPDRTMEIRHQLGGEMLDVIWVSLCPIISAKFVETLQSAGLTGWKTFPVRVFDRDNRLLPGYEGLAITGRSRSVWIDKEHTTWIENHRGVPVRFWTGIEFDKQSWDGSDLFRGADGRTDFVVITSKAYQALTDAGLRNFSLRPTHEVRIFAWTPRARRTEAQ